MSSSAQSDGGGGGVHVHGQAHDRAESSWEVPAQRASGRMKTAAARAPGKRKATGVAADAGTAPEVKRPSRKRPKRKTRTSEVRRNEIELLQKESKYLKSKVEFLKYRTGAPDQQSVDQQSLDNTLFREWLRNQKYVVAGLKSAVATDMSEHYPSPLSTSICLGTNHFERREYLLAIKPQKIHDARQFLAKRTMFLDMAKPFSDLSRFQTPDGALCASKLDIIPLCNAASVKQVYDTLLYYALNVEISTADVNGDVVIREEAETGDESVSQNRFVFLKKDLGIQVETNNAIFCEYTPPKESGSSSAISATAASSSSSGADGFSLSRSVEVNDEGLITTDFVDEDELHPYRPHERLRDDVTSVFTIKSYRVPASDAPRQSPRHGTRRSGEQQQQQFSGYSNHADETSKAQEVVVLTRWFQAKFHPTKLNVPVDTLFDLRKDMDRVSDAMIKLVRDRFRSAPRRTTW